MENQLSFDQLPAAVSRLNSKLDKIEKLLLKKEGQAETQEPEQLLTIQQAAYLLHLSVLTLYGKVHRNELPYMKRGKRLYFSKTELLDYIKAGRKLTNDELKSQAHEYLKK